MTRKGTARIALGGEETSHAVHCLFAMPGNLSFHIADASLRAAEERVCALVREAGGRALLVGGSVRDAALGRGAVDLDIEVYGIEPNPLIQLLSRHFSLDLVGKAFGVVKLRGVPIDISLPRREAKVGSGHRGFSVDSDPRMSPEEAARRRDFTINAIAFDPLRNEIIDPYGGLADLERGILRHTSEQFGEDPLRVLRGMQFVARFDLDVAPETLAVCREIEPEGLPRERIFDEWRKLLLQGHRLSRGLEFIRACDWLRYFPELEPMLGCEQNRTWHPEGDVWTHVLHCLDFFAAHRIGDAREDFVVGLAVLCHDLGKPATTVLRDGKICARGHARVGEDVTRRFLARMTEEKALVEEVVALVGAHLSPRQLYEADAGDAAIRRLARRVGRIDRLVRVARADQMGRPPVNNAGFPPGEWLLERARALAIESSAPEPLVQGRHLLGLGMQPGPGVGAILDACYEAQIDGRFASAEEGVAFARRLLRKANQTEP